MKPLEFSQEEFDVILQRSQELIRKGYFKGVNFLQSENVLPKERIIIHFLHTSKEHIEDMLAKVQVNGNITPRHSFYKTKPSYYKGASLRRKYNQALFYDVEGKETSIANIPFLSEVFVLNPEWDLLIPLQSELDLEDLVTKIQEANRKGIDPWRDPVIILRADIQPVLDFGNKACVTLSKDKEEFYTILSSERKKKILSRYLRAICEKEHVGNLLYDDLVFSASQVNKEFLKYLRSRS